MVITASVDRSDKWTSEVVKSIEEEVCHDIFFLAQLVIYLD